MDPRGLPGSGADVSPTMPDTPADAATLTWFTYKKGDVWRTALWLECVRCQHGIRPGTMVRALSASLRYGPQIVHDEPGRL